MTGDPGYLVNGEAHRPVRGDTLLFTEEASLVRYLGCQEFHFMPKHFPPSLLDDKLAFGRYVSSQGVIPLPQWVALSDVEACNFPIVLKARHSWENGIKMPRGWVCKTSDDVIQAQKEISQMHLTTEQFFVQKWVNALPEDNFSVCGFWDAKNPQRNLVCVVQRRMAYGAGLSSSSVVAVVPDPSDLQERCAKILDGLHFQGPFELEFLRHEDTFYALELNPRFWMQHGLFVYCGNGLLKRYMKVDNDNDWGKGIPKRLVWIDGMWLLRMFGTFRWAELYFLYSRSHRHRYIPVVCPHLKDAFSCSLAIIAQKIKVRFSEAIARMSFIVQRK